jgi:hypothetical protein
MNIKLVSVACLVALIALAVGFQTVYAHESVTVGDYTLEIGWVEEPPIAGQRNAVVVNVSEDKGSGEQPVEDVSGLVVSIAYGGQTETLELQPLGEDTPGQFIAPIVPMIAGEYTVDLGGKLGDTQVSAQVTPEEVQASNSLDFPNADGSQQGAGLGLVGWMAIAGLASGLAGLLLSLVNMRKRS